MHQRHGHVRCHARLPVGGKQRHHLPRIEHTKAPAGQCKQRHQAVHGAFQPRAHEVVEEVHAQMGVVHHDGGQADEHRPDHHVDEHFLGPEERRVEEVAPDHVGDVDRHADQHHQTEERHGPARERAGQPRGGARGPAGGLIHGTAHGTAPPETARTSVLRRDFVDALVEAGHAGQVGDVQADVAELQLQGCLKGQLCLRTRTEGLAGHSNGRIVL